MILYFIKVRIHCVRVNLSEHTVIGYTYRRERWNKQERGEGESA